MGEAQVNIQASSEGRAAFISYLLDDVKALETMLEQGLIEEDMVRIGAEQEFCLVTDTWRPSNKGMEVLSSLNEPHFTTELARFNLELNLDPLELKGKCFTEMHRTLDAFLAQAEEVAARHQARVVLTGILPTISKKELDLTFMTPSPRYRALNDVIKSLRGSDINLYICGIDELSLTHDSVLFEACNTSFQLHLQIPPADFISSYNWAQAIAGPILGVSTNSPLLLGRELWSETRIALFQQSIDTRSSSYALKDQTPRVTFGTAWAHTSVAEIFKSNIARHKVILYKDIAAHSTEELAQGRVPKLPALNLHNGTVYHWNRACYGTSNGKAHLRIENRYLPAGPSTADEMANFAFWVGLMKGRPAAFDDLPGQMDFRDAKANFIKSARTGPESVMRWMGEEVWVKDLVRKELLPLAYAGLQKAQVDPEDAERFLQIIEKRTEKGTGSQWCVRNYRELKKSRKKDDALLLLTKAIYTNQQAGLPVHAWPAVAPDLMANEASTLVGHIMSTELFTLNEHDLAELATSVMRWKNIHHLPVENLQGQLSGLLTWTHMLHFQEAPDHSAASRVADIMVRDLITVRPDTEIRTALHLMRRNNIGCLPVVQDRQLVGIITAHDLLPYGYGEGA